MTLRKPRSLRALWRCAMAVPPGPHYPLFPLLPSLLPVPRPSVLPWKFIGGDSVSTKAVATRRHAGRHLPAIGWKNRTANTELALAAETKPSVARLIEQR